MGAPMFNDQGREQPVIGTPADIRGGFQNIPDAYMAVVGFGGTGIVDMADSSVSVPFWNDGANP